MSLKPFQVLSQIFLFRHKNFSMKIYETLFALSNNQYLNVLFNVNEKLLICWVVVTAGGRNVDDQNVDRPKISERRNGLFS